MEENSEQKMLLCSNLYNSCENNQIKNYFNLNHNIKTINRIGPYGNTTLRIATFYGYKKVLQVLLTNTAFKSLQNNLYNTTLYDESRIDEIKKLFQKQSNLFSSHEDIQDYDYIEWSVNDANLIQKRKDFREQIDLYKTYDNQHHLITKLLIEIIEYYLNEYLIQQEQFSKEETQNIENYFKKAIEEQNYLKYFIKAYTLTNNFYRVLNKHLALYILHYFDPSSYSSLQTKHRLINCLVHIVTLLINHPDINKYKYNGITYRGLLMKESDLKCYSIGNYILNRSFVSTSKNRSIAQLFADNSSHDHSLAQVSVLLKYTIKRKQTGIDIEHLSMVPDEEEVLILPFSVFQIKDRIESCSIMSSLMSIEIDLEEYEDNEQINNEKQKSK